MREEQKRRITWFSGAFFFFVDSPDSNSSDISLDKASTRDEHDPEALIRLEASRSQISPPVKTAYAYILLTVGFLASAPSY
jgi:hypothetical protein